MKDIRDIFFENIKKKFNKNKDFYILTNDVDVHSLRSLRGKKKFIDAGVAEQNLINMASGISSSGTMSLIYGFCTFLTYRCYEQIKFSLASHKANCKIVGIGPGYSFPYDGPTHHGTQDIYAMYLIPEMEIYNIADNNLADKVSKNITNLEGPTYIRLDKGVQNYNLDINYNLSDGFNYIYRNQLNKNLIITSGYFCKLSLDVAKSTNDVSVINLFKLKNFNNKKLYNEIKKYENLIIYDESSYSGGITPILLNNFAKYNLNSNLKILTSPDIQLFKYSLDRIQILKHLKIFKTDLVRLIKQ